MKIKLTLTLTFVTLIAFGRFISLNSFLFNSHQAPLLCVSVKRKTRDQSPLINELKVGVHNFKKIREEKRIYWVAHHIRHGSLPENV